MYERVRTSSVKIVRVANEDFNVKNSMQTKVYF